jgi:hypothetical protein
MASKRFCTITGSVPEAMRLSQFCFSVKESTLKIGRCIDVIEVLLRRRLQVFGEEEHANVEDARLGGGLKSHVLISGKVLGTPLQQIAVTRTACS